MDYGTFFRVAGRDTQCVVCLRPIDQGEGHYRIVGAGFHLCQCGDCPPQGAAEVKKVYYHTRKVKAYDREVAAAAAEKDAWLASRSSRVRKPSAGK